MQNTTLTTIPLNNLDDVTGGTHPADGGGPTTTTTKPDGPQAQPQGTLGSRLGELIAHLPKGFTLPFGK